MLFNRACTQKTGVFENLTFSFNFILIVFRHSKNEKNYPRHKIDVKFPTESIPIIRIHKYIDLHLEILIFLLIFDFTASPFLLHTHSKFRFGLYGKFYTGYTYSVLKIFSKIVAFDTKLK